MPIHIHFAVGKIQILRTKCLMLSHKHNQLNIKTLT